MKLRPRLLLLSSLLLILACTAIWLVGRSITLEVAGQWALRQFSTQVQLEKERSLKPIIREVALARQLAESPAIKSWAKDEHNAEKYQLALAELNTFRQNFADNSYFVALLESGRYFHNNAADEYRGQEYRYTLDPGSSNDQWFYSIIARDRDMHLNVNPDVELQVTKLWIDVLIRDGNNIYGAAGTGLNLDQVIADLSSDPDSSVQNLFFDEDGAIQIAEEQTLIDFASITKSADEQKTVWQMFGSEQTTALRLAVAEAQQSAGDISSLQLYLGDIEYLAGIVYLPEIRWYVMTLLPMDSLIPATAFYPIFIAAALLVLLTFIIHGLALNRYVLTPLTKISDSMDDLRLGTNTTHEQLPQGTDEIGMLMSHMRSMADDIQKNQEQLEDRVQQRTRELEELTQTDPLTGLLNRRGMMQRLELEMERHRREGDTFGIIWLDLDDFKLVNDDFGHGTGDRALEATAAHIRASLRTYDYASRWGGDEFLILVRTDQPDIINGLGQRLCEGIRAVDVSGLPQPNHLTVSAGSCILRGDMDLNQLLACADKALYFAKGAGRNQYHPGLSCHSCPGCEHDGEPRQSD